MALQYRPDAYAAPQVVAGGVGELADRILRLADENNVPVHRDDELAALLSQLDVGSIIPPELYAAVAEVLAFVYRMKLIAEEDSRADATQTRAGALGHRPSAGAGVPECRRRQRSHAPDRLSSAAT